MAGGQIAHADIDVSNGVSAYGSIGIGQPADIGIDVGKRAIIAANTDIGVGYRVGPADIDVGNIAIAATQSDIRQTAVAGRTAIQGYESPAIGIADDTEQGIGETRANACTRCKHQRSSKYCKWTYHIPSPLLEYAAKRATPAKQRLEFRYSFYDQRYH
jgi:hypothetical protein